MLYADVLEFSLQVILLVGLSLLHPRRHPSLKTALWDRPSRVLCLLNVR